MNTISIKKHAFLKLTIVLVLFILVLTISSGIEADFNFGPEGFKGRVEIILKDPSGAAAAGNLITLGHIDELKKEYSDKGVCYSSMMETTARSGNSFRSVKAVLTDYSYTNFMNMSMLKGAFFTRNVCYYGLNAAVISDELAYRLFASYDIIGNDIYLFKDQKFKIIGIYKNKKSIVSLLGYDGIEKVYLPFRSHPMAENLPVQTIAVEDGFLELEIFKAYSVEDYLNAELKVNTWAYKITDYYSAPAQITQFKSTLLFLIGLWAMILLLIKGSKLFIKSFAAIRRRLKDKYLLELLKSDKKAIIKLVLIAAGIFACIIAILMIIKFNPHIPDEYIPQDNIFDMGFYTEKIKSAIAVSNSSHNYIPSEFEIEFKNSLKLSVFLFACSLLLFISTVSRIRLVKLTGAPVLAILKRILISFICALILSLMTALLCGITYIFPARELLLITVFIILQQDLNWNTYI